MGWREIETCVAMIDGHSVVKYIHRGTKAGLGEHSPCSASEIAPLTCTSPMAHLAVFLFTLFLSLFSFDFYSFVFIFPLPDGRRCRQVPQKWTVLSLTTLS